MPIQNYSGQTFVAFLDISGFKELMKDDKKALEALKQLYQAGYDALLQHPDVEGFFVSDSGILFVRNGDLHQRLVSILAVIKNINLRMLQKNYMVTTSISYGYFDYHDKLEFNGIEKNPIYGNAYVQAFLDNEKGLPKLTPGQCRLVKKNLPTTLNLSSEDFELLKPRSNSNRHLYFYWNLTEQSQILSFETSYNDSYQSKYSGMLLALRKNTVD